MFRNGRLTERDFYFTADDYRYRFEPKAKQLFIDQLRRQFNAPAKSHGTQDWSEIIHDRAAAFGRYLMKRRNWTQGTTEKLDFTKPEPILDLRLKGKQLPVEKPSDKYRALDTWIPQPILELSF